MSESAALIKETWHFKETNNDYFFYSYALQDVNVYI